MGITVHFREVGAQKQSWTARVGSLSDLALKRQIKKRHALASRDIDFDWNEDGTAAVIWVGLVRRVGAVLVEGGAKCQ